MGQMIQFKAKLSDSRVIKVLLLLSRCGSIPRELESAVYRFG